MNESELLPELEIFMGVIFKTGICEAEHCYWIYFLTNSNITLKTLCAYICLDLYMHIYIYSYILFINESYVL